MADALTDFIIKPSAPFAAGVILFGAVWGFFKGVESVLTDDTKLEIAVWLLGVKIGQKVEPWPETFSTLFDRVFGKKLMSLRFLWRSSLASFAMLIVVACLRISAERHLPVIDFSGTGWRYTVPLLYYRLPWGWVLTHAIPFAICFNVIPDFICVVLTRISLAIMKSQDPLWFKVIQPLANLLSALGIGILAAVLGYTTFEAVFNAPDLRSQVISFLTVPWYHPDGLYLPRDSSLANDALVLWTYPTLMSSLWLCLYQGSGFLLKAARRFDLGFDWFNRKFDIEKKPLSAIGLVAGALVAVVYWGFAVGAYLMKK